MKRMLDTEVHSTDLNGTCDKTNDCNTLTIELSTLKDMGVSQEAIDTIVEYRHGVCASIGRCSLYFGIRDTPRPQIISQLDFEPLYPDDDLG